ncbi:MAG TPA: glycosyltransferase family 39 protein [Rhodocyclaceae bacterium]|nr:glycosyltransferase family 39 protein [Rhodocyclaceae bacterium]
MSRRAWIFAALIAFALVWFGVLDYRKLVKPDEGRYAEIPREMAASGNWLTPRLNGIKYFEKPPLQYWATAAAFTAFGESEWTARLWTAVTGFLGVMLAWFAGRRLFGPSVGMLTAPVLASSLLYLAMGHIDTLDMGFAFFLEVAVVGFLLAQAGERRWMMIAWAGLAFAVLSKGIAALVLTGSTVVLYSLLTRDFSCWRRFEFARGVPLFLLIAAPWFIAVSLANHEFPGFFFIHEHFERFLTKVHNRYQPAWYFIPIFLLGALPWTTLALQSLAQAWSRRPATTFQPRRFLLLWCAVVFGFFSVSSSKLPSYILPLFPALALLLADMLNRISRQALLAHLAAIAAVALAALVLAPGVAERADEITPLEMVGAYADWLTMAAAIWLAGTLVAIVLTWRNRKTAAMLTLAVASLFAWLGVLLGHENLNPSSSAYQVAMKVKPLLEPGVPFYSVRMYDQTLPFYLRRTVTLVEHQDEMAFGLTQEPGKWVPSVDEFKRRWNADADAFAIMEPDQYDALRREGWPMIEVARDTRRVIVRKTP